MKLKRCPFCGGKHKLKGDRIWDDYWITCDNCKVTTPRLLSKEKVIDLWNKRTKE